MKKLSFLFVFATLVVLVSCSKTPEEILVQSKRDSLNLVLGGIRINKNEINAQFDAVEVEYKDSTSIVRIEKYSFLLHQLNYWQGQFNDVARELQYWDFKYYYSH
ncbi:MAG: hypothetical protein WC662_03125 [Candidatus Paceibacterota bacterium]|jgi:hypothetical protein